MSRGFVLILPVASALLARCRFKGCASRVGREKRAAMACGPNPKYGIPI